MNKQQKDLFYNLLRPPPKNIQEIFEYSQTLLLGLSFDGTKKVQRPTHGGAFFLRKELKGLPSCEEFFDLGDLRAHPQLICDEYLNQETLQACRQALYGSPTIPLPVSPLSVTHTFLKALYTQHPKAKILGLGGNQSNSYPLIKNYCEKKREENTQVAIIHFDAYPDLSSHHLGLKDTSPSWCNSLLSSLQPNPPPLVQIGLQHLPPKERKENAQKQIQQYSMDDISSKGTTFICHEILSFLKGKKIQEIYINFDMSVMDSQLAGAVGILGPRSPGLYPHQAVEMIKEFTLSFPLGGAHLMEVAPLINMDPLHSQERVNPEPNSTLAVGAALCHCLIEKLNQKEATHGRL